MQRQITVPIAVAIMSLFAVLFTGMDALGRDAVVPSPYLQFTILEPLW